jgi:hypothetical protein
MSHYYVAPDYRHLHCRLLHCLPLPLFTRRLPWKITFTNRAKAPAVHSAMCRIFQNRHYLTFLTALPISGKPVAMSKEIREADEALALYLDRVTDLVAWQVAKNGDKLPTFFVLPTPTNAEHLKNARNILTDFCIFGFDADRPPILYQDGGTA